MEPTCPERYVHANNRCFGVVKRPRDSWAVNQLLHHCSRRGLLEDATASTNDPKQSHYCAELAWDNNSVHHSSTCGRLPAVSYDPA